MGTGEGGQVSSAPPEELEPTLPEISLSPQAHKGGQNCSHFCGYWTTLVTPKYCGILEKRCSSSLLFFFYIIPEKVIDNHLLKGTFIRCQTFPCLFFHCCQLTAGAALTWEWDHHNIKVPYSSYRLWPSREYVWLATGNGAHCLESGLWSHWVCFSCLQGVSASPLVIAGWDLNFQKASQWTESS